MLIYSYVCSTLTPFDLVLKLISKIAFMKIIYAFIIVAFVAVSCSKTEGPGGTSSLNGKVLVYDINGLGDTIGEPYYAMDQDVFLIYGESDDTYDDKFATSFDGSYRFDYLTPGKYTVFTYSRCDTCNDGTTVVKKSIEITANKSTNPVSDLIILK